MEYNKPVQAWSKGDQIEGYYILKDAVQKQTGTGKPFLSGSICDANAFVDFKAWDYNGPVSEQNKGSVVKLRGEVSEYKGSLQLTIYKIRTVTEQDEYDLSRLVPTAPIIPAERLTEISDIISSMQDDDYKKLSTALFDRHKEVFSKIPAGKSMHHSFLNGLLMHTSNMLRMADFLASLYSDILNRDLLLTGTLLHDLAKEQEFICSELGLVTEYSVKGQLLGHLVMGAQEVAEISPSLGIPENKSILVQHMILSHHGDPEFGAAVIPCFAESELLSYIDNVDSRMEIYAEQYEQMETNSFSSRIFALDKKIFKHD